MTVLANISIKSSRPMALLARLRAELAANRRAALGFAAIVGIGAVYGLLGTADGIDARRERYIEMTRHLDRLREVGRDKAWPTRAATSGVLRAALETRLWPGDTDGIVQAGIQDWVTNQARQAGLERVQVTLETTRPKDLPANFRQVSATITALDTEPAVVAFLDRISRDSRLLVVDQLKIEETPVHSMEMRLLAFAVVRADGPTPR
jgi:hypothetical protein